MPKLQVNLQYIYSYFVALLFLFHLAPVFDQGDDAMGLTTASVLHV